MEKTFVIIKPGAIQRGFIGEIITRFERKGLRLRALKMAQLDEAILRVHYAHLVDRAFFPDLLESMMATPVILMCWEGVDAVAVVRNLTGATNGRKAAPGTIRGDFSMSGQENVVHASDSVENATVELARFFVPSDFFEYPDPLRRSFYAPDEL